MLNLPLASEHVTGRVTTDSTSSDAVQLNMVVREITAGQHGELVDSIPSEFVNPF